MDSTDPTLATLLIRQVQRQDAGEYRVVAKNQWGSKEVSFNIHVQDVPSEPTNLQATDVQPTRLHLSWTAPRSDSRITAYRIERRDNVRTMWTSVGSVDGARTSYDVVNITPGTDYWFRVIAENDVGASEPCAMTVPVRSKDKIEPLISQELVPLSHRAPIPPPSRVRHTEARRGSLALAWEPPSMPEPKYRVKSYIIERDDMSVARDQWQRVAALPPSTTRYTVPDLYDDHAYRFRLYTETDYGLSLPVEYEAPDRAPRRTEVPYRPVGPIIINKVSAHSLQVEWRPPMDDGGEPVLGYAIEMSEGGSSWKKVGYTSCRDTRFTIAGLTEGATYFFRVSAENAQGFSKPLQSDCVVPTKPIMTPSPPSALRYGTVRHDSVALEWEAPAYDGGASLTGYLIEKRNARSNRWSYVSKVQPSISSYSVPGLLKGQQYMFRIRPTNRIGLGDAIQSEEPITIMSPFKPPSAPRGPVLVSRLSEDMAEIQWSPPDSSGGTPITGYIIEVREASRTSWRRIATVEATASTYTLRNMLSGLTYYVRIIARNVEGESTPLVSEAITPVKKYSVPGTPNLLQIVRSTHNSVALSWFSPVSDVGSPEVKKYRVYRQTLPVEHWEECGTVRGTTYTVPGLREGKQYIFGVRAENEVGLGDMVTTSRPLHIRRTVAKPVAPKELTVTAVSEDSVSLSWHYHDLDQSTVSSYRIERRAASSGMWETVATVDSTYHTYTVRHLRPGTDYFFRVVALNTAGASAPPRSLDQAVVPRRTYTVPDMPRGPLEVTDMDRSSITLSWLPPKSDGGAALISYIIEKKETSFSQWVRVARVKPHTTSYTISNLYDSREYLFRVIAENVEGQSPALSMDLGISPRRPASRPEPPSGRLRVRKVTRESVVIEWGSPSDDGGSRITSYLIEYRETDAVRWHRAAMIDSKHSSCTIKGLKEHKEYLFRVISVNSFGESLPLEVDFSVRPLREAEAPAIPGGPLVVSDILRNSMTVSWQPPHSDGGAPITGYIIEKCSDADGGSWSRVERVRPHIYSYTLTNLSPHQRYRFRVIAENSVGRSRALESRTALEAKSPYAPPSSPAAVRVIGISEESITIEWSEAHSHSGAPITNYVIERREGTSGLLSSWQHVANVSAKTTSYVIQYLKPNGVYYIRVAAENEEGVGEWRELAEPVTPRQPASLPAAPAAVHVDCLTRDSVTLRWERPKDTGGVPLSGYIVEQVDGSGAASVSSRWRVAAYVDPTRTWWTVHNLIQGYDYNFRVRAENPDGAGAPRALPHPVIPKPVIWRPGAPGGLEVTAVWGDGVTLAWLSPERDGGARITRYIVEMCDVQRAEGWVKMKEVSSNEILLANIEGLKEGKAYLFRVSAENEVGIGPATELSDPIRPRSQLGAPGSPQGPLRVVRVTRNMLAVHWRPPRDPGAAGVQRYLVERRAADRSAWSSAGTCPADVTTHCVTDLDEDTMYYIRVCAENAYGLSEPLEIDRPIIPKRIFEGVRGTEVESWIHEAQVDSSEVSRVLEESRLSISHTSTSSSMSTRRAYSAYADEPLTSAQDIVDTMWLSTTARL